MTSFDFLEEYFVKIHKHFGISGLDYRDHKLNIEEQYLRNSVLASDEFNEEFENLLDHCRLIYNQLQQNYSIKIRKDPNDNYCVLVA